MNEHNGWVPRDFWLEDWEKQAIIGFHLKNQLEGYRRLKFMMLDADIVVPGEDADFDFRLIEPASVVRARLIRRFHARTSLRRVFRLGILRLPRH